MDWVAALVGYVFDCSAGQCNLPVEKENGAGGGVNRCVLASETAQPMGTAWSVLMYPTKRLSIKVQSYKIYTLYYISI